MKIHYKMSYWWSRHSHWHTNKTSSARQLQEKKPWWYKKIYNVHRNWIALNMDEKYIAIGSFSSKVLQKLACLTSSDSNKYAGNCEAVVKSNGPVLSWAITCPGICRKVPVYCFRCFIHWYHRTLINSNFPFKQSVWGFFSKSIDNNDREKRTFILSYDYLIFVLLFLRMYTVTFCKRDFLICGYHVEKRK